MLLSVAVFLRSATLAVAKFNGQGLLDIPAESVIAALSGMLGNTGQSETSWMWHSDKSVWLATNLPWLHRKQDQPVPSYRSDNVSGPF